jgi:hypothetical protein
MAFRPEELAELASIPVEAAQLVLDPPPGITEQQRRSRFQELVPITNEQRGWVWEIHKNCDQLLHQRLASFTAAQAMTLRLTQVSQVCQPSLYILICRRTGTAGSQATRGPLSYYI